MPFLLLDDATDEATRRLQDFGQQQLANLTQAGQTAQGAVQGVQQTIQQAPQQVQGGLQDITARLQDFGQQQVQNAVKTIQPLQQAAQQKQQDTQNALGRLQTFGSDQLTNLTQPPPQQPKTTDQLGGGDQVQPGGDLQAYARQAAQKAGIDPDIFTAQIQQESGFSPTAKSPAGAIGIAQFMPQCVVLDAEILTTDGWKTYDQVHVGESIVSYNAATDQLEPDRVEALYVGVAPSVVRMWNKRFDFTSTSDHRWYVRRGLNPQTKRRLRRGGRTSKPAGETIVKRTNELQVAIRHNLIRVAPFAFRPEPLHSDELIALCGWVFSDGSIGKRGRQVDLYQSERANATKCAEIEQLISAVGGGASRLGTSDGMRRWCLTGETAAQISDLLGPDKRLTVSFLERLTRPQAELLYRACLDGDGYTIAGRYDCFIQSDLGRAEDFQLLCLFLGLIANIQTYARKAPTQTFPGDRTYAVKPKLHVNVRVAQTTQTDKRRMQYETIDVPTPVWCPTTRNQTWVARRAGMVTITGNTAQGMGIDPTDPYAALDAAAKMDAQNLAKYNGDWSKTLAAYNAGPGAVDQYGGVPPYAETQSYVKTILGGRNPIQAVQQGAQNVVQGVQQKLGQVGQAATDAAGMIFPVVGYKGDVNLHWGDVKGGSDLMAPRGTAVVAMQPGKVVESGFNKVGGNSVLIQGDDGNQYYYAHLDQAPSVKVGDRVGAGAYLGPVGNTGDAAGGPTHLHLGIGPDILLGADKYGGTGGDYDAVGLLRRVLNGQPDQAPTSAAGPQAISPPTQTGDGTPSFLGMQGVSSPLDLARQGLQDITTAVPPGQVLKKAGQGLEALANQVPQNVPPAGRSAWTLLNQGADLAGQAPLPMGAGRVSDLASVARGGLAAADVIEQQRQRYVNRPSEFQQFMDNVDAARNQDWGRFVQGTFDLAQRSVEPMTGGPQADISQAVSAGLTAGGLDPDSARVLGQVANVIGPVALERAIPEVVGAAQRGVPQVAGAALSRALGAYDVLRPPEEVFASTFASQPGGPQRMSVPDLVTAIQQYPEEVQQGLRDFVQAQTQAGAAGADINDALRQWVADNPLRTPSTALTLEPEVAASLRPGSGPLAAPLPEQSATDVLTGLQNMARERTPAAGPPLETLTSGQAPVPPAPLVEPAGPTPPPPTQPGLVGRILGAPGAAASRFGSLVASALGPVENLPTDTAGVLRNYANMVGRQSDAARVMAENQLRTAGARLDIPAVAEQVQQVRGELRDQAARTLVDNLQAQGKAAPIANAPREFRTVTDNPNTYLANYAFSPDVVAPIKAVTDMSDISANPLGSAVLKTIGTAKGTLFSLSNFHTLTEALNAAFTSPQTLANYARAFASDSFAQGLRSSMADTVDAAARAGVTGLAEHARPEDVGAQIGDAAWRRIVAGGVSGAGGAAAGYTETKLTGGTEEEARANAAKGGLAGLALAGVPLGSRGTLPEILQSALWDRAVPLAKATAWDALTKGGMDANQAASVVNERFGGLNYAAMGRNPTLLDAQRLTLMASDWNEATVRQLGSAIFGGDGRGVRAGFLAKTIGGMLAATEAANYAFSGHSTLENQPGHQFEVELQNPNGGYLHFGILPGNVQSYLNLANTEVADPSKRATAPTNFIVNRLSAPVGAGLDVALSAAGRPPFQVAKAGPVALGENVAPIGVSQVLQSTLQGGLNPAVAAGLAAAGLNPRYSSARGAGGGFAAPQTTRAPLPSRTTGGAQSGERAPVPRR